MITLKRIKMLTESKFNVGDLATKKRDRHIVYCRQVAIRLSKEFLKSYSLQKIGSEYNKDHATVLHSLKEFEINKDQPYFLPYYSVYAECRQILKKHQAKFQKVDLDENYETIHDLKIDYKIKMIKMIEKSHNIINRQRKAIDRLAKIDVFKDIADLSDEEFKDFQNRTDAFLKMLKAKNKK